MSSNYWKSTSGLKRLRYLSRQLMLMIGQGMSPVIAISSALEFEDPESPLYPHLSKLVYNITQREMDIAEALDECGVFGEDAIQLRYKNPQLSWGQLFALWVTHYSYLIQVKTRRENERLAVASAAIASAAVASVVTVVLRRRGKRAS